MTFGLLRDFKTAILADWTGLERDKSEIVNQLIVAENDVR